ncbi:Mitogen-activated protein kinase kinase kinase [Thalictrum thalictroides]|uniref:Mitogen-activated protein kinase kinase kinase n=1 Tax=Thalictrum thalictroides TaxID=46969 RepID=A0A7J6V602_THATH|nr:Mitogen-activated protein kinase kinase kinase [Thalictrum thalictroides]
MNWTRGHSIGHGSSSAMVCIAKAHTSNEVFAVKSIELLKSEFLQREQRILSSLNCSKVVGCMGFDVTNENGKAMYNLFMEYVVGGALSDKVRKEGGSLKECVIRSYTRDILEGLDYLHMNGLVHCDIKGGNILISDEGAKIADLGCSKWFDETSPIAGTPAFMAPEVARNEEQSYPADIWALGCTIIEMATGSLPWMDAKNPVSALYRIAFSEDLPEIPSFLSDQAKDFLSKCLIRDAKERWTTTQLLQHPFLSSSDFKQIQNSPTSILDQGFWDSMEESADSPRNLTNYGCSSSSAAERLRQLSSPTMPNWASDEDWITIRSNKTDQEDNFFFSGEQSTTIRAPTDDATATTSGSEDERFFINHEEEMELISETSVSSDMYFLNDSISEIRSSRNNSLSIDCSLIDVCKCVNLNSEMHSEFTSFNQNLLKA